MAESKPAGPEKPTIIERAVKLLPGPYFLKCLIFWIVFGTPGMVLTRYLDTFSFSRAVALFGRLALPDVLGFSLPNFVMPFYAFYAIRYMRLKIVETMPELESVTVGGAESLDKVFRSVSRLTPAAVFAVLFGAVSATSFPGQTEHVVGVLSLIVKVVGFTFAMLAYGIFVWMFVGSVRGIHRLGEEHLRFVSFLEDRYLGVRGLGSMSLSLVWVYFLGISLGFFSFNPPPVPIFGALIALVLLGVVLFFLPLYTVHVKMVSEKRVAEKALRVHLKRVIGSLDDREDSADDVADMVKFQLLEQKVLRISEWPFDTATLSWFSAIVITVLGTIITRYLFVFTGL